MQKGFLNRDVPQSGAPDFCCVTVALLILRQSSSKINQAPENHQKVGAYIEAHTSLTMS